MIPPELLPGTGSVSIVGGRQALVEDHRGILEYSEERIVLALKRGKLSLTGSDLQLQAMNRGELLITGRIQNVEWG
ncbi:MAG: YabP/YqfC family sporulation protein [Oscillospiraceae bacterium]|nr:YabP/YqfC family sporulation protein [Oscillospiraceae bacterium]